MPKTYRAKIFKNGRSQAVRLPKEVRFDEHLKEVLVRKDGDRLILTPVRDEWPQEFLDLAGSLPDFPDPPPRTPLSKSRVFRKG